MWTYENRKGANELAERLRTSRKSYISGSHKRSFCILATKFSKLLVGLPRHMVIEMGAGPPEWIVVPGQHDGPKLKVYENTILKKVRDRQNKIKLLVKVESKDTKQKAQEWQKQFKIYNKFDRSRSTMEKQDSKYIEYRIWYSTCNRTLQSE